MITDDTWLISDTHFGHDNIIKYCCRPDNHEEIMLENWNTSIGSNDNVLHLGDLCMGPGAKYFLEDTAPLLNGKKKLILGNHDKKNDEFYNNCGFEIVSEFEIKHKYKQNWYIISFSHYPLDKVKYSNQIHIHGHIHNNGYNFKDKFVPYKKNQINISVEQTKYKPVLFKDLIEGFL